MHFGLSRVKHGNEPNHKPGDEAKAVTRSRAPANFFFAKEVFASLGCVSGASRLLMASPSLSEEPQKEHRKPATGQQEMIRCNVEGCNDMLPRHDLPIHLADHFTRLRHSLDEQDERIEQLEGERVTLEERQMDKQAMKQTQQTRLAVEQTRHETQEIAEKTQLENQRMAKLMQQLATESQQARHETQEIAEKTQQENQRMAELMQRLATENQQIRQEIHREKKKLLRASIVALVVVILAVLMVRVPLSSLSALGSNHHLSAVLPFNITMTNFTAYNESGDRWFSEPFYTHLHGYKVCLEVRAGQGSGDYVSVGIRLRHSEFDDNLDWPFNGNVTIQLLDKKGTSRSFVLHCPDTLGGRVITGEMADRACNFTKIIAPSKDLQDGALRLRVTQFKNNPQELAGERREQGSVGSELDDPDLKELAEVKREQKSIGSELAVHSKELAEVRRKQESIGSELAGHSKELAEVKRESIGSELDDLSKELAEVRTNLVMWFTKHEYLLTFLWICLISIVIMLCCT